MHNDINNVLCYIIFLILFLIYALLIEIGDISIENCSPNLTLILLTYVMADPSISEAFIFSAATTLDVTRMKMSMPRELKNIKTSMDLATTPVSMT